MATREVTSVRQVAQVVPKQGIDLSGVTETVGKIHAASQEAKIMNNLTEAQLEINNLTTQYRLDNQSDPMAKMMDYDSQVNDVLQKYGEGINPLYKGQWANQARRLVNQSKLEQQAWTVKQNSENAITDFSNAIDGQYQLAYLDGQKMGAGEDYDVNLLAKYEASRDELFKSASNYLGEETANKMASDYQEKYMSSFLGGLAETNPEQAKKYLEDENVKRELTQSSRQNIQNKIVKAENNQQNLLVDGYKNRADMMFANNPYEFKEASDDIARNGDQFRQESGIKREGYDKVVAYNNKLIQKHKENLLFDFYKNPTKEGLDEILAMDKDISEKQSEKLTEIWEESPNYEMITTFRGYDDALSSIQKLSLMNTNTEGARIKFFEESTNVMNKIKRSNIASKDSDATLSAENVEDLSNAMYEMVNNEAFKELLSDMPDMNAFSRIMAKTMVETDTAKDRERAEKYGVLGSSLIGTAQAATVGFRGATSEYRRASKIERIGLQTAQNVLGLMMAGDKKGATEAYERGIKQAIRSKYYYIPEMSGRLVENETTFNINGKPYLFKGFGGEDIIVEAK